MELTLLDMPLSVCRLEPDAQVPEWVWSSGFMSITRTPEELSIVCEWAPGHVKQEAGWRAFKIRGPLEFGLVGVLASVIEPLRTSSIPVFVISTFDTDYLLVKGDDVERAREALTSAGHILTTLAGPQFPPE
jgi:hypothetical protein